MNNNLQQSIMAESVRVTVRCRPLLQREKDRGAKPGIRIDEDRGTISVQSYEMSVRDGGLKAYEKNFQFDKVFGTETPQHMIYEETTFELVESVLEGYNCTIFAYGQTGSGKTYTMAGNCEEKGIIGRAFGQTMTRAGMESKSKEKRYLVSCSYMEIYNEEIKDLLDPTRKLQLKESPDKGVFVKDLAVKIVQKTTDMDRFMQLGLQHRSTRETALNKESSRSHTIFSIYVESTEGLQLDNLQHIRAGKFNLVDLAGSERQSKLQSNGEALREALKINLSLSALGNVISALIAKAQHIPYRTSKLTRLLQDSLGGNARTVMIATISSADLSLDETLSTLRYATRAKLITNKPIINEDPKDALIRQYAQEIKMLKRLLQQTRNPNINTSEQPLPSSKEYLYPGARYELRNHVEINSLREVDNFERREANERGKDLNGLRNVRQEEKGILPANEIKTQLQSLESLLRPEYIANPVEVERIQSIQNRLRSHDDCTLRQNCEQHAHQLKKRTRENPRAEITDDPKKEVTNFGSSYQLLNHGLLSVKEEFSLMHQQLISNDKQIKELKSEIRDLRLEHLREKADLEEYAHDLQKQTEKYISILEQAFSAEQMERIIRGCRWNQELKAWKLEKFRLQGELIFEEGKNEQQSREKTEQSAENEFINAIMERIPSEISPKGGQISSGLKSERPTEPPATKDKWNFTEENSSKRNPTWIKMNFNLPEKADGTSSPTHYGAGHTPQRIPSKVEFKSSNPSTSHSQGPAFGREKTDNQKELKIRKNKLEPLGVGTKNPENTNQNNESVIQRNISPKESRASAIEVNQEDPLKRVNITIHELQQYEKLLKEGCLQRGRPQRSQVSMSLRKLPALPKMEGPRNDAYKEITSKGAGRNLQN